MMIATTYLESLEMKASNLAKLLNTPSGVTVEVGSVGIVKITSSIDEELTIDVSYDETTDWSIIDIYRGKASCGGHGIQQGVFPDKEGDMDTSVIVVASVEFGIEAVQISRRADERVESVVKFDFDNGWRVS